MVLQNSVVEATMANRIMRIVAMGDSHSKFWDGHDNVAPSSLSAFQSVKTRHIGPVTAYQAIKCLSNVDIINTLKSDQPDLLITSFGEIDCRAHIVKQAHIQNRPIEEIVESVFLRYAKMITSLQAILDCPIVVWAPPPSSPPEHFTSNAKYPAVGTVLERNYATYLLIARLTEYYSKSDSVAVASIFEDIVTTSGLTKPEYLFDGCHLAQSVMPQAIKALSAAAQRIGLPNVEASFRRKWQTVSALQERDVAIGAAIKYSSIGVGVKNLRFGSSWGHQSTFTSLEAPAQWVLFDLKSSFFLYRLEILCGTLGLIEDLIIEVSIDGVNFTHFIQSDEKKYLSRFVRIKSVSDSGISLVHFKAIAATFDAR